MGVEQMTHDWVDPVEMATLFPLFAEQGWVVCRRCFLIMGEANQTRPCRGRVRVDVSR